MKIGINTFITDQGIAPGALGKAIEDRGFESLFIAEHSHIPVRRETPYPGGEPLPDIYYRTLDPFVALTAAAATTRNLLLGTGILLLNQHDPIHAAKEVASLDLVSGGRAIFGIGVGWNREEMRNHGTDPRTRGRLVDERIEAIKAIWTQEQAEYHGEFVDFDPIYSWPKPVQTPHVPIYIGGNSDAALRRTAAHGDGWLPNGAQDPAEIRDQLAHAKAVLPEGTPVSVGALPPRADLLTAYAEAGAERATLYLPTESEAETLRLLDEFAEVARQVQSAGA